MLLQYLMFIYSLANKALVFVVLAQTLHLIFAGFSMRLHPQWSGLLSSQQFFTYTDPHTSCSLSVVIIWSYFGRVPCGIFLIFLPPSLYAPFFSHVYHSVMGACMSLCGALWLGCGDSEHFNV